MLEGKLGDTSLDTKHKLGVALESTIVVKGAIKG